MSKRLFLAITFLIVFFSIAKGQTFGEENLKYCDSLELYVDVDWEYRPSIFGAGFDKNFVVSKFQNAFAYNGIHLKDSTNHLLNVVVTNVGDNYSDLMVFGINISLSTIQNDVNGNLQEVILYTDAYIGGTSQAGNAAEAHQMRKGLLYLLDNFVNSWKRTHK